MVSNIRRPAKERALRPPVTCIYALALALCLVVFYAFSAAGQDEVTASATLSPSVFGIDDMARLTITVNGTRSADLELPESEDFEIIQRGSSKQLNVINGKYSSSVTFTCQVQAFNTGHHTIPPVTITVGGQTITTEPIPFRVGKTAPSGGAGASPAQKNSSDESGRKTFLEVSLPKNTAYIGELFPIEIKAYFRRGMRANLTSKPELVGDGLVMAQLSDKPSQTQETVGGTPYTVLTWSTNVSTIKEGNHPFHLELQAVEHVPQKRTSSSLFGRHSPFDDDFFDSMLGGYSQRRLKLASRKRSLEVLPLPEEGRPQNFSGAVGQFHLHAHAEPTTAEQGEPITLSISVRGQGNFDRVEAPAFPARTHSAWRTYTPASTFHPADESGLNGEKIFEQAIVARNLQISEVPALSFSYFNPEKGVYVSTETSPIPVQILGANGATQSTPAPATPQAPAPAPSRNTADLPQAKAAQPELGTKTAVPAIAGLAPLHLTTGSTVATLKPIYRKSWFLLYVFICLVLIAGASLLKIRRIKAQGTPEQQRRRRRTRRIDNDIALLQQAAGSCESDAYLQQCRSVIQQHLGSLWHCEPGAITSAGATAKLPANSPLASVLQRAEHAVYSGAIMSSEEMAETTKTIKFELENLI